MQAIAIAGGQGQLADLHEVMVYRREGGEKKIYKYDLVKIRAGETEDPSLVNDDVVVVKRAADRVVLRDSLLGDIFNLFNPFTYAAPAERRRCPITTGSTVPPAGAATAVQVRPATALSTFVLPPVVAGDGGRREPPFPRPLARRRQAQVGGDLGVCSSCSSPRWSRR